MISSSMRMPRRLLPSLLLLAVPLGLAAPRGRAAIPPPRDAPLHSAVLSLTVPSLHARWLEMGGPVATAAQTRQRARARRAELADAEARIQRAQRRVERAAEELGVQVIDRYEALLAGLLVHGTEAQLARLARHPEVAGLRPAPRLRPQLSRSVPRIGADRVASELGYDGQGVTIAIIDAGIDYTHAHFGGPGTSAAYARAAVGAETIDDRWNDQPLFPTEKVVGGWDFVGPRYTAPPHCSPEQERAGRCSSRPEPDPDPLDQHGHGTHVAGIAAGHLTGTLAAGVAPGARLVALKLYGPPASGIYVDEEVDVVLSALDWCARVNLDRPVEGTPSEQVDVINLSLGEPYGQGAPLFEAAVAALVEQGVVVVASAGNEGNNPYVLGAPGAARGVLSVANTSIDGEQDQISGSSSRGPSRHGGFGPSLSAPGTSIRSARFGTGDQGRNQSGTSMSAPHVAGAAALLVQRDRVEQLGLGAGDLAALLMNTASPAVLQDRQVAPVSRQGAGRVDVARAAESTLLARAGDIADLDLGFLPVTGAEGSLERPLRLRNLGAEDHHVLAAAVFHRESAGKGLRIVLPDEPLRVPAGGEASLTVTFHLESEALSTWPFRQRALSASEMDRMELDGQIRLRPVDAEGRPAQGVELGLPFRALPRRASRVSGELRQGAPPVLRFANDGQEAEVELYALPEPPAGLPLVDPDEPALLYDLDLAGIGLRYGAGPADEPLLEVALWGHEPASAPGLTITEIYLDVDDDGRDDWRLRYGALAVLGGGGGPSPFMGLGVSAWDPVALAPVGDETRLPTGPVDVHAQLQTFSLPLEQLGSIAPGPMRVGLLRRGVTEDWLRGPAADEAPDGMRPPAGQRYRLDPGLWSHRPEAWSLALTAGETGQLRLLPIEGAASDTRLPRLLAVYPSDAPAPAGRQAEVLAPRRLDLWLPMLLKAR